MRWTVLLLDIFRMGVGDLAARPLRTVLTIASFVISIVIAVVLLSGGEALRITVADMLRDMGDGQIVARSGRTTGVGGVRRSGRQVQIRYRDLEGVETALPSFVGVAPFFYLRGTGATSWRYSIPWSPIQGVDRSYRMVRQLPMLEGRWFTEEEEEDGEWVTVLNHGLRKMLFRDQPVVGQWVEWRGRRMTVVGVVRDESAFPYILYIPYQTVELMSDARYISGVIARPVSGADWDRAVGELRRVLGGIGGFSADDENALEIETNQEFTRRAHMVTAALHALVITIAGVSLLLGGLGVANMMVIAVTERTGEIGLRKALGATRRTIFLEIFLESLTIILAGGATGIAVGAAVCAAVGQIPISTGYTAALAFDPAAALVCLGALGTVAVLSATIPARRAASLPPAEALRWE